MATDETLASAPTWPAYAAFCDYFATGEGRTVIVAIGTTAGEAKLLFEANAPAFFASSLQIVNMEASDPNFRMVIQWVPAGVIEGIARSHGPLSFFALFHQNVS